MSSKLRNIFFKLNVALLALVTLNLWILLFTRGYEISLGPLMISSHRPGRLFLYQIILAGLLRLFFYEDSKAFRHRHKPSEIPQPAVPRAFFAVVLLSMIPLSLLAFTGTISSYFLSDDFEFLNLVHRSPGLSAEVLVSYFQNSGLFRPLSLLTLYLDYQLWGLNPFGFHLTSLLFHIGSTFLVFLFLWHLTRDKYASAAAGFFFAVYPIHLEAVAWISGRFDVTCTFFFLLSLLLYLYFRQSGSLIYQGFSLLAFLGALLSKEMALTLPIVILVVNVFFPKNTADRWGEALKRMTAYWVILAGYVVLRILILKEMAGSPDLHNPFFIFKGNLIYALKNLILRPFRPLFLPFNEPVTASADLWETGILAAISLFILTLPFRHRLPFKMLFFGLLFIVATAIPTFRIFYVSETLQGSRFLYLPSIGACMVIALLAKAEFLTEKNAGRFLSLISASVITALFLWALQINSGPWIQAGKLSKKMSEEAINIILSLTPPQQVYTLHLPDNIQGAYVFRNGFSASLSLLGKPDGLEIMDLKKIQKDQLKEKGSYTVLAWVRGRFHLYQAAGEELILQSKEWNKRD
jgi:hypothetical protein